MHILELANNKVPKYIIIPIMLLLQALIMCHVNLLIQIILFCLRENGNVLTDSIKKDIIENILIHTFHTIDYNT